MLIADIIIGERSRKDLGDLAALAASIDKLGLLHPVVVRRTDNVLIAGERRIKAFGLLNRSQIPVTLVDIEEIAFGQHAENEIRKDFTVTERVAIGMAVEAAIGNRQGERRDRLPQEIAEVPKGKETRQEAAEKAGFGNAETYRQAKVILENGAPELVEAVDAGRITISAGAAIATRPSQEQKAIVEHSDNPVAAAKAIRDENSKKKQEANAAAKAAMAGTVTVPHGKFGTIVIDPPWEMEKIERDVRPNQVGFDYPTMNEDELIAFKAKLDPMVADDCHLFMWTTQRFLLMAQRLVETYGFRYVLEMVWHKPGGFQPIGLPQYNAEFIVYARRGSPEFVNTRSFNVCNEWPRREHSRKPQEFYELIARVTGGKRIDVFARERREGFETYGNEVGKFAAVATWAAPTDPAPPKDTRTLESSR
jgi:N6-adenosine-specific RNA methylase IME4/ParB-like chromosome segregation protein Spo0J